MRRNAPAIRLIAFCLLSLTAPPPAQAEGLFDFLFGDSDSDGPSAPPSMPAQRQWQRRAPRDAQGQRPKNVDRGQTKHTEARSAEQSGDGFCVRTCDGYFFPLIRSSRATGQQSCEFLCPSAAVELYAGSNIETARNSRGQHYASLPTAFSFQNRTVDKCACNDPNASASYVQQISRTDPTLRSGDVIVEDDGPFVYNGASLVTLGRASFMSGQIRDRLRALLKSGAQRAASGESARAPTPAPAAPVNRPPKPPMEAQGTIEFVAPSATQ